MRGFQTVPKRVHVRENLPVKGVLKFFSERVFGPDRRDLLLADLRRLGDSGAHESERRLRSLERGIEETQDEHMSEKDREEVLPVGVRTDYVEAQLDDEASRW